MRSNPIKYEKDWLILCEGSSDQALLRELINRRQLPDFQVQHPFREDDGSGGWTKFGRFLLEQWRISQTFQDEVKAILVVADNDSNPQTRFGEIQGQIGSAGGFGVPNRPQEVARAAGFPDVVVLMLPMGGQAGCLEDLLLEAMYSKWNLRTEVNNYLSSTMARDWPTGKLAKAQVRCVLAATCRRNPDTPVSRVWRMSEEYHIPVDHHVFNELADFLRDFDTLLHS